MTNDARWIEVNVVADLHIRRNLYTRSDDYTHTYARGRSDDSAGMYDRGRAKTRTRKATGDRLPHARRADRDEEAFIAGNGRKPLVFSAEVDDSSLAQPLQIYLPRPRINNAHELERCARLHHGFDDVKRLSTEATGPDNHDPFSQRDHGTSPWKRDLRP